MRDYTARVDIYRSGAKVGELVSPADSPPEISGDESGSIPTGLRGTFIANDNVDWLRDELRPVQVIDGEEYPAGVFLPARVTERREPARLVEVEAYDRAWRLQTTVTEDILLFNQSESYAAVIGTLLTTAGIALRQMDYTEATLSTARADWPIGTDYLTIVNGLLSEINYDPVWFDASGVARLHRHREPDGDNVVRVYDESVKVLLQEASSTESDLWDKPNVFIVVCQNPELSAPIVKTVINDSPASALSTVLRGRRIAKVYKVDNTASEEELQSFAERVRYEAMMSAEVVTLQTANLPGVGIGETVGVRHPAASGVYRETGWTLTLAPGSLMTHTLQKKVII